MTQAAAVLQLLIGLAFVSFPVVRHRYGAAAQAAAEAELGRQAVSTSVIAENKVRLDASGFETTLPAAVAVIMAVLAALNFASSSTGELLTWIFQPLVLIINLLFLYSQVTAATSVAAYFAKTGEPELQSVDVKEFLKASHSGFPSWVIPGLQNAGHVIVIAGSIVVLVLVAAS